MSTRIKASQLKSGDIFIYDGREKVAIDNCAGGCIWVTNRQYYIDEDNNMEGYVYGYTSAALISLNENVEVELVGNMVNANV